MKRSEMVKILERMLHSTDNYTAPVDYYLDVEGLAKEILETIEEAGMTPPTRFEPYEDLGGYIQYNTVTGWEDEEK
jgi:hypothetical protein